jgi:recombination protein RecR
MPSVHYPTPIQQLIQQFHALPGIGPRSAERIVLWLLSAGAAHPRPLAEALSALESHVEMCPLCGFFSQKGRDCLLCSDARRSPRLLCVVEQAADVLRLERSGAYHGHYHVLGGKLSPLDNVTPEDLRLEALYGRVKELDGEVEVILALGSDVEGEATANYIGTMLRSQPQLRITRLAQGMPAGGGLDHVDEMTLHRAMEGRRELQQERSHLPR